MVELVIQVVQALFVCVVQVSVVCCVIQWLNQQIHVYQTRKNSLLIKTTNFKKTFNSKDAEMVELVFRADLVLCVCVVPVLLVNYVTPSHNQLVRLLFKQRS